MRNNLLFFGFPECSSVEERRSENCAQTLFNFFRDTLKIVNPSDTIKIERAHRIGRYDYSKKRPIVAMFNHFPDKQLIKQKFRDVDNQSSTSDSSRIRCSEQFPSFIQERRKNSSQPRSRPSSKVGRRTWHTTNCLSMV